jgi:DNA repair protein RadA/Sms
MSKVKTQFVCQSCGYISPRWIGKCPECNTWNSFVEEVTASASDNGKAKGARSFSNNKGVAKAQRLNEISISTEERISTGITEFDRVLGGGIMPGSIVLVGGDPGIGKSTLMMQMIRGLTFAKTLYVSGEESASQLKSRAERLGLTNEDLFILSETNVEAVLDAAREDAPHIMIVDSIQTMFRPQIES